MPEYYLEGAMWDDFEDEVESDFFEEKFDAVDDDAAIKEAKRRVGNIHKDCDYLQGALWKNHTKLHKFDY